MKESEGLGEAFRDARSFIGPEGRRTFHIFSNSAHPKRTVVGRGNFATSASKGKGIHNLTFDF
jgi:hypothetical protein